MAIPFTRYVPRLSSVLSPKVFFWIFTLLIIIVHIQVFRYFNMVYTDSDQPNMWHAAVDFSEGRFYEPRYYGQAYNTNMEALFAVPLLWMNIPVYYALPIATHLIAIFPLFFIAFYLYSKKHVWNAAIILGLSLCFPLGNDMLSSIPRGFVTGVFFTGFFVTSMLEPKRLLFVFINTLMAVLAFFASPNTLLVSGPFLFFLFLNNYSKLNYYLLSLLALSAYIPLYFIFDRFYILYPDVAVHKLNLETNIDWFLASFQNLDIRFGYISPFVQMNCIPLLLLLLLFGFLTYRWDKKAFAAFVLFILLIVASFSNAKTADGFDWVFMPMSRMYLGIPIMIYLFLCIKKIELNKVYALALLIPVLFTGSKLYNVEESIVKNTQLNRWDAVLCMTLEKCLSNIDYYRERCKTIGVNNLIISNGNWTYCIVSYGGPAVYPDYPRVEILNEDRRYWIKNYRRSSVFNTFMLLAGTDKLEKVVTPADSFKIIRVDDYGLYLVTGNKLTKKRFAQKYPDMERLARSK